MGGGGTIGDAIGTTGMSSTTTSGTTREAELVIGGVVTTEATAAAVGHPIGETTEARIEVPANAGMRAITRMQTITPLRTATRMQTIKGNRLPERLETRARLVAMRIHEVKVVHAPQLPVITAMAERGEAIRRAEDPALAVAGDSRVAVVSMAVAAHIANEMERPMPGAPGI